MNATVVLWVNDDGTWRHGTESDDVMAVELVGTALFAAGAGDVMICAPGEHPDEVRIVLREFDADEVAS